MAVFLTPRLAPAYQQQCGPFSCRPAPQASRPRVLSFAPFLNQVDDLLSEISRGAQAVEQLEACRPRQQRKRTFRAKFDVREGKDSYQVDGEVPGFDQDTISIEVTDEYTLKVAGDPVADAAKDQQQKEAITLDAKQQASTTGPRMDGIISGEPEIAHSDTESNKSYQATVEDDFEDLGAETRSASSLTAASPLGESKGKEKAMEEAATKANIAVQGQWNVPSLAFEGERREWISERQVGSFERTFRFPERIDGSNARASLRNGVLSINVPKAPIPKVRRVAIL